MSKQMKNFLTIAGIVVLAAFLAFLYDCVAGLSDFVGRINPALAPWVFWGLLALVGGSMAWWLALILSRPKPLLVHADPSPEELARFRQELVKRLSRNRILKDAGVNVRDESGLELGLTVLRKRADEEIRSTAKRVFIGSAVSQNGRLDSLVVLFLITRLAWRISKLYCQRPPYRELVNLYVNIAVTSFLAGSIEEFGIEEYIHELIGPLFAGSALGAVPGSEAVAGVITTSILSGSTNALLAMRCGIVARNYMSLDLDARGAMRRSATLEAARMFMSISSETVTQVTKLLVKGASAAVRGGARKTLKTMGRTVTGAAGSVGSGARTVGRGVTDSTRSVVDGVDRAVDKAAGAVKGAAGKVRDAARKASALAGRAGGDVRRVAGSAKTAIRSTGGSVERSVRKVRDKALFWKKKSED
ncbi:DUF697 domain-containing protein [Pseudodesulfovibrio indicus]|uniref:Uncharacterized protein DUF697 n=1 Tax=Pseudodesulfovibrio indicus TaxID=1716143 RepID=A0A126QSU5_9BACT|nr:DUF697 domain-containing protein [Pseudodesulfovibrio indicus]AMK12816.1 hypothetical protein AWY79_17755 [Pseudodesulfovibrio indicus]TDT86691.1 uncharacterized protein DUF697 [Pseudodesulfovibrio indicus]